MDFLYLGRKEVEAIEPLDRPHIFISVRSPGDPDEVKLPVNDKTVGQLHLVFHEIYEDWLEKRAGYEEWVRDREKDGTAFVVETGATVLEFVQAFQNKVEIIVVHCDAGLARSPSIALALSKTVFTNQENRFFTRWGYSRSGPPPVQEKEPPVREAHPTCYRCILEAWLKMH